MKLGLRSSGWAQGACAGDYDNDGFTDLFVTYWGKNRLYRNVARQALQRCDGVGAFNAGTHAL